MNLKISRYNLSIFLAFLIFIITLGFHALYLRDPQGLVSSLRLLLSLIFWPLILKKLTENNFLKFIFLIGVINSSIAIIQFYDSIFNEILPEFLKYGYLYGFEDIEPFRKGGIVNGLQLSSLLALLSILIGFKLKIQNSSIWLTILITSLIIGSRTILVLSSIPLIIYFFKKPFKSALIGLVLVYTFSNVNSINTYIENRIIPAFKVFLTLDVSKDYSSKDTYNHYVAPSSSKEFIIGNGYHRYSILGGGDPIVSRWLIQSGIIVTVLLLILIILLLKPLLNKSLASVFLLLIILLTSLKGELITAIGVFDLLVIYSFVILPKKKKIAL